jgi:biotin synthase
MVGCIFKYMELKKWDIEEADKLSQQPLMHLLEKSHTVHKTNFNPNEVQVSTLLSIKTGSCSENCSYCPQSAHFNTGLKKEPLMQKDEVRIAAEKAKIAGSSRFCIGAAWRGPRDRDIETLCDMIREIKSVGLESCASLGLLTQNQANMLKDAGLDFYNHNIDSSPEFYEKIITTRSFQDRIQTLEYVRNASIKICCGGIIGMGETTTDRIKMLVILANMDPYPESVPINRLIKIPGTPLEEVPDTDPFEFLRIIAVARILMPKAYLRIAAGRETMSEELQALCIFAGANSLFYGEKLLTAKNPLPEKDESFFKKLGLTKI